jgi:pyrroline-5-carboxylate reductase
MNVGLLGCGHIAHALVRGWVRPAVVPHERPAFFLSDIDAARAAELAGLAAGRAVATTAELAAAADLVIFAIRPQDAAGALAELRPALGAKPLVSLAAGLNVSALLAQLEPGACVGRVMPNVNVTVGEGALLLDEGTLGPAAAPVRDLFALVGQVVPVAEELFDAATAVAGCGPGFVTLFMESLEAAGAAAGLPAPAARSLTAAAFVGTSLLVRQEGDPAALRSAICSPGGMTAAGVAVLEERGLRAAIDAAVRASVARARELA